MDDDVAKIWTCCLKYDVCDAHALVTQVYMKERHKLFKDLNTRSIDNYKITVSRLKGKQYV